MLELDIPFFVAFISGTLSFFSPCVLPLIPVYISFITGLSVDKLKETQGESGRGGMVFLETLLFVTGFTLVFVAMGATLSSISGILLKNQKLLKTAGGVIIIIFGLHVAGLFKLKFLDYEKRISRKTKPVHIFGSLLMGMIFAVGWTPCIGPMLAAILTVAATRDTMGQGIWLLCGFSLGLGIPFIITGLLVNRVLGLLNRIKKYLGLLSVASGILLIAIGVLLILGYLKF
jgi:cytochrome c-type biogenesis protein